MRLFTGQSSPPQDGDDVGTSQQRSEAVYVCMSMDTAPSISYSALSHDVQTDNTALAHFYSYRMGLVVVT